MSVGRLLGSAEPLAQRYDVALLDLDGVVYLGGDEISGASSALARAREFGMRLAFVTNNAARPPATVAAHLSSLGIPATTAEVVTSAQAAAHYLADRLQPGSRVLVVGTTGLIEALTERGLVPVSGADEQPAAVVQGYSPDTDWRMLAEGAVAIHRGIPWIATNLDPTVPSARGPLPGNGSLVAALRHATGATPTSTGKPAPTMHREMVERSQAQRPLVVGDRLDTDIEGANAVGCASMVVLTGVTAVADLLAAPTAQQPDYVAHDLRGLLVPHGAPIEADGRVAGSGWSVTVRGMRLHLAGDPGGDNGSSTGRGGGGGTAGGTAAAGPGSTATPGYPRDIPGEGGPGDSRIDAVRGPGDSRIDAVRCLCVAAWTSGITACAADDEVAAAVLAELGL